MTVRDIQRNLATTLGVDMSPDTISTSTDVVLGETMTWQNNQFYKFCPVDSSTRCVSRFVMATEWSIRPDT